MRITWGLSFLSAATTSGRQPSTVLVGMSEAVSIQRLPGPRNAIESVALVEAALAVRVEVNFCHSPVGENSARARTFGPSWSETRTGVVNRVARVDRDSVLRDADRRRRAIGNGNPLAGLPVHRVVVVQPILGAVDGAAGVPGLLAEVGLLDEDELVGGEPFKVAVAQLLRPHAGEEGA